MEKRFTLFKQHFTTITLCISAISRPAHERFTLFKRHFIITTLCILTIIGCGRFDNEYTSVISPDEVSNLKVSCVNFLGVPTMCAVINETTKTVRVETIVSNIVERIVKKEVVTEVPVEQIVKRVETRYIVTGKKVDIEEIVKYVIARIKEYVPLDDIINVPTDVIVDETTDYITNPPPPNKDKDNTTLGGIRDETPIPIPIPTPDEDNDETTDPNSEGGTDNGTNNDGGSEGGTDNGTNNDGGSEDGTTPGTDSEPTRPPNTQNAPTNGNVNDGGSEGGTTPRTIPVDGTRQRLHVQIGPRKMDFQPSLSQPGLDFSVTCNVDGNIIHPSLDTYSIFRKDKWNFWGVQFWCDIPPDIAGSDVTINVTVSDFKRWCGLTKGDVSVLKFTETADGQSSGGDSIAASINLKPNSIPACDNNNAPMFGGTETTRSIAENTTGDLGDPISATDDDDDDTLTYTLGGTDASTFSIDSSSGQLKTSTPLNYEVKNSYSVSVTVSDGNGGTDTIGVDINVTDANDAPMLTGSPPTTVAENTTGNFGDPISATDEDDDPLTYTLRSIGSSPFTIDPSTGQLKVKTNEVLNYEESPPPYWLQVKVSDDEGLEDSTSFQISITDANDAPVFTEGDSTTRAIIESAATGTNVGAAASATDEDTDDTLEYTLSGTDASSFSIDSSTGQLTTNTTLDYDTKSSYSLTVGVSDGNGGTDSITVTINIHEDVTIPKEEFFEIYYAIKANAEIQIYTIRGYGSDNGTSIYVDNYYKFEDGSSEQFSTGWGGTSGISQSLDTWKGQYSTENGYVHGSTKVSIDEDTTSDEARKEIYQTLCGETGISEDMNRGITYPNIANNTSSDILDVDTLLSYFEDDDCDLDNN